MISFDITSFKGEELIGAIATKLKSAFPLSHHTKDYLSFDLPDGKMKCSVLNSGLTIGLVDLRKGFQNVYFSFSGSGNDIPYKIGFCYRGSFFIDYPNEQLSKKIQSGENLIITPKPGSQMHTCGNTCTSFLYIFISPKFVQEYFNINEADLKFSLKKNETNGFSFALGKNSPQINLALGELFKDEYTGQFSKIMLESKALELLTLFFNQFVVSKNKFSSVEKNAILAAHEYILSNLEKTITVHNLTNLSGLNEHKLQQGFKTLFGTTMLQHIKKMRIQKAHQLITKNNYTVSEAGYAVGYTNLSHFASAFKQEYNMLPSDLK